MIARLARLPWAVRVAPAALALALMATSWAVGPSEAQQRGGGSAALVARGAALYQQACSDCHGIDLRGIPGQAPTLHGVGSAAVDFSLSTGRMPLARPGIEPERADPAFGPRDIEALIAFVMANGGQGGPPVPAVRPQRGSLPEGRRLFATECSGCHQIMGQGGIAPGLIAPALGSATPKQIGEAIRVGPYLMPHFPRARLDDRQVDSIARYVTEVTQDPPNRGGWGIGNIGPVPEGLAAFLLAGTLLLIVARVIGERNPT